MSSHRQPASPDNASSAPRSSVPPKRPLPAWVTAVPVDADGAPVHEQPVSAPVADAPTAGLEARVTPGTPTLDPNAVAPDFPPVPEHLPPAPTSPVVHTVPLHQAASTDLDTATTDQSPAPASAPAWTAPTPDLVGPGTLAAPAAGPGSAEAVHPAAAGPVVTPAGAPAATTVPPAVPTQAVVPAQAAVPTPTAVPTPIVAAPSAARPTMPAVPGPVALPGPVAPVAGQPRFSVPGLEHVTVAGAVEEPAGPVGYRTPRRFAFEQLGTPPHASAPQGAPAVRSATPPSFADVLRDAGRDVPPATLPAPVSPVDAATAPDAPAVDPIDTADAQESKRDRKRRGTEAKRAAAADAKRAAADAKAAAKREVADASAAKKQAAATARSTKQQAAADARAAKQQAAADARAAKQQAAAESTAAEQPSAAGQQTAADAATAEQHAAATLADAPRAGVEDHADAVTAAHDLPPAAPRPAARHTAVAPTTIVPTPTTDAGSHAVAPIDPTVPDVTTSAPGGSTERETSLPAGRVYRSRREWREDEARAAAALPTPATDEVDAQPTRPAVPVPTRAAEPTPAPVVAPAPAPVSAATGAPTPIADTATEPSAQPTRAPRAAVSRSRSVRLGATPAALLAAVTGLATIGVAATWFLAPAVVHVAGFVPGVVAVVLAVFVLRDRTAVSWQRTAGLLGAVLGVVGVLVLLYAVALAGGVPLPDPTGTGVVPTIAR